MPLVLVHNSTLLPVKKGDRVVSFRGEEAIVDDWQKPHNSASTGRILVREGEWTSAYYPSVYNCSWGNLP